MKKKEAIVKYITEMNSDMLYILLDDDKTYMDVPKETFITKLEEIFQNLKYKNIDGFFKVVKGHCGGSCNNGCGGYSFLTIDNQSLDLLFEEENSEIKDIYRCTLFVNEEQIKNKKEIYLSFYNDEKTNYIPSSSDKYLKKQIEIASSEFNEFKNDITDLEAFYNWAIRVHDLYDRVDIYDRIHLDFTNQLLDIVQANSSIMKLISLHPRAKKAMKEYINIHLTNESELVDWVLKYEDGDFYYGSYKKANNWEQNNLILHPLDNSVVIDCSKYAESVLFSVIQPKHHWELYEKYLISEKQFNNAKDDEDDFQLNLMSILKIQGVHQDLLVCKTDGRPYYFEYVIGEAKDSDQFIDVAGKELGINVKIEYIGTANSFIDEKGVLKPVPCPTVIRVESENKKANQYYSKKIGLDWKSKLHNKKIQLFKENQIDECQS